MQITLERQSKTIALSFNTDNSIAYDELYLAVQDKMSAIVNGGKFFVGKAFTIVGNAVSVLSKNIYVQGLTVAAAGGLGSRLAGGSFELGFLTAGLAFAVNQVVTQLAQENNPANSVANDALDDKHLTLSEANSVWRANNDPNFEVTVDASKLSVKQTGDFNDNGTAPGRVRGRNWLVHGSVTLSRDAEGNVSILRGQYDFQSHGSFWSRPVRNFETYGGFYVGSRAGFSVGTDYWINYSGSPNVSR